MDQPLPTRSQLNGALEFFASFAGSRWDELGVIHLKNGFRELEVPEQEMQTYVEKWLRGYWEEIVDEMVDSDCAAEDPQEIIERWCPRTDAHGGPHRLFNDDGSVDYECPGIKAHPLTQIGKGEGPERPTFVVQPRRAGKVSTHRNAQMLRDMGHDV